MVHLANETTRTLLLGPHRLAVVAFSIIFMLALALPARADLITNGNFETTSLSSPGGYFCQAGSTCVSNVADWTSVCDASSCGTGATVLSLLFASTNGSAFNGGIGLTGTIADSPDGGNYVGADGDPQFSAPFSQTINGLDIGSVYTLTFDQAAAQQAGTSGDTTERWQVTLGGDTQLSTLMTNPSGGFQPWNQQSMTFTATSTSEVLTFLALGTPGGEPPVSLLDGVSLVGTPEPSSLFMGFMSAGLLGVCAVRRQRKKRA
jgi:hypothetical protein